MDCSPGHVAQNKGQCRVTFVDPKTKGEPNPVGQKVCFSVSPSKAGEVGTGAGHCAIIGNNDKAFGTFTASGKYCGKAVITATEAKENGRATTPRSRSSASKTRNHDGRHAAGRQPSPPATGGWLLGAMGVGVALVTGYAMRTRRWFAPRRLAAGQSA